MFNDEKFHDYVQQFDDLIHIAIQSHIRTTKDPVDLLFEKNLNVFTKSYIVSACSILEAFIQDITFSFVSEMDSRLAAANIPRNIMVWSIQGEFKKNDVRYEAFQTGISKKNIEDLTSGNFFKTIKVFEKIGIDIGKEDSFRRFADSIGSTVDQRNKIIHQNDKASDLTMLDVVSKIENFKAYTSCIYSIVKSNTHLQYGG